MPDPAYGDFLLPVGQFMTTLISFGGLSWWLSNRFTDMRKEIYDKMDRLGDKIMEKMEYHEKHDDNRFSNMQNDIFAIKLRNAAKDGSLTIATTKEERVSSLR